MENCVYCCIEGENIARTQCAADGLKTDAQIDEALQNCGFAVCRSSTSLLETLQTLNEHVQLASDSSLLPTNVPKTWLPAHCCTCRRLASVPTTLYKLPCAGCESMYCCSMNCWASHVKSVHNQSVDENQLKTAEKRTNIGQQDDPELDELNEEDEEGVEGAENDGGDGRGAEDEEEDEEDDEEEGVEDGEEGADDGEEEYEGEEEK